MDLLDQFKIIVGDKNVLDSTQAQERSAGIWARNKSLHVKAIVLPNTTEEVSKVMALCNTHKQNVVPHGGLSNLTFATQANENDIILSLERMNIIEEVDVKSKVAIVQSGVILQVIQEKLDDFDLLYPIDFGARGSAMIGGTISTNAGGIQVLRYGTTRNQVLGLEVVLADGRILSSLNKMIKDNAGYNLKHLFIGSEGTLGIITKASLKLYTKPKSRNTAFVGLESFDKIIEFKNYIEEQFAGSLSSFEVIWNGYYKFMTSPPRPFKAPLSQDYPFYVLFDIQGNNIESDHKKFENILGTSLEESIILDGVIAYTESDYQWFWGIRENVEHLLTDGPIYIFDVSLPIPEMKEYCEQLEVDLQKKYEYFELYIFGHLGDGNLHIGIRLKENFDTNREIIESLVYKPLKLINGSITAEHGIGLEKKEWLHVCRSEEEIGVMKELKQLLDPNNILNPGKIF